MTVEKKPNKIKKLEVVETKKIADKKEPAETSISRRPIWTGSLTIGLINVPVKLYAMIYDRGVRFHFLHKLDNQPLRYQKVCTKDEKIVP